MRSYLRGAMRKSRDQLSPSCPSTSSGTASPYCASVFEDWDAYDEDLMSSGEFLPSRPLSLAIPTGPYCPRRPTLHEVLANSAPPPWTLSAFMAYLSQNHCLETLEFTMDASRYRKYHESMVDNSQGAAISPDSEDCRYVRMLWQKLLDAYIVSDGPREVNLPSDVRNTLLSLPNTETPPHPSALDQAVKIIYELMDESVLVPFLNSVSSMRGAQSFASPWTAADDTPDVLSPGSAAADDGRRDQNPLGFDLLGSSLLSRQSNLSAALGRSGNRHPAQHVPQASVSSFPDPTELALTDDSGHSPSPSSSALEPMTPPTTPPFADLGVSPGTSPKNSRGEGIGWKKMGAKLGWKKSRSGQGSTSSSSNGGKNPVVAERLLEEDVLL